MTPLQRQSNNFEQAILRANEKTKAARQALIQVGKMTPRVERLIDEAEIAWNEVEKMLGNEVTK